MPKVIAVVNVTLDGVMQGPASPNEDGRDGFDYGGWAVPGNDPDVQKAVGARMGPTWSLLVGRNTYEHLYEVWPKNPKPNPFTDVLNRVDKFVASRTLSEPLPWENSHLLKGEVNEAVSKLKSEHGKSLVIFGSSLLVQSLMEQRLVDEFVLPTYPIVLGKGHRLFEPGVAKTGMMLVDTTVTASGVIVGTYQLSQ